MKMKMYYQIIVCFKAFTVKMASPRVVVQLRRGGSDSGASEMKGTEVNHRRLSLKT